MSLWNYMHCTAHLFSNTQNKCCQQTGRCGSAGFSGFSNAHGISWHSNVRDSGPPEGQHRQARMVKPQGQEDTQAQQERCQQDVECDSHEDGLPLHHPLPNALVCLRGCPKEETVDECTCRESQAAQPSQPCGDSGWRPASKIACI